MKKGGYVLVNATGLDVSDSEAQTITGLYSQLEAAIATGKLIILEGVMNGETPVSPAPVTCTMGAGASITMGDFKALVTDDDEVTPIPIGG